MLSHILTLTGALSPLTDAGQPGLRSLAIGIGGGLGVIGAGIGIGIGIGMIFNPST